MQEEKKRPSNFRLYEGLVERIAQQVVRTLNTQGKIEIEPSNIQEAQVDLIAIMDDYLMRDRRLRDAVRERMSMLSLPFSERGSIRYQIAREWNHPLGRSVPNFLANQFIYAFFNSGHVEEVYADDYTLRRTIEEILDGFKVDEDQIREEAEKLIKNMDRSQLQYEIELRKKMNEVRRRKGLIFERGPRRPQGNV